MVVPYFEANSLVLCFTQVKLDDVSSLSLYLVIFKLSLSLKPLRCLYANAKVKVSRVCFRVLSPLSIILLKAYSGSCFNSLFVLRSQYAFHHSRILLQIKHYRILCSFCDTDALVLLLWSPICSFTGKLVTILVW